MGLEKSAGSLIIILLNTEKFIMENKSFYGTHINDLPDRK